MSAEIHLFTVSPRSTDPDEHWPRVQRMIDLSERYGVSGVLVFTGNDVFIEPWVLAQHVIARAEHLIPLVAVNPVYMHPFTVAKLISSFAYAYGRRTYLNMVAGAALSYQRAIGDTLEHDLRYERLREYIHVVRGLLTQPRFRSEGRFYPVSDVQLSPRVPEALLPGMLLSGQSEAAMEVARATGSVSTQMLPGTLLDGLTPGASGIHFGLITRPTEGDAWAAARRLFPEVPEAQAMLELSMKNTDSRWKQRMMAVAKHRQGAYPGYWLDPFRNLQADCPYYVGDHADAADLLRGLARAGVTTIILDLPPVEEEMAHVREAIARSGLCVVRAA
ncbi:LLM class flavin-dependent oxidoreductase [Sorangium sp. So ce1078]|uniref:LLM class flavin-dependent oxidoreductase n=1 Tax=Sorangium sp. So ce1078 TaxID=3133329 RepID=UPI003F6294C1